MPKTLMPTFEQMKAAAILAQTDETDPVVLATALGLILTARGMLPEAYAMSRIGGALIRDAREDN